MKTEFRKFPVNGRKTSVADIKSIREIISNSTYRLAQECQVLVSYPLMRIEGKEVILGAPHILLPNCRLVTIKELKEIEVGRRGKNL